MNELETLLQDDSAIEGMLAAQSLSDDQPNDTDSLLESLENEAEPDFVEPIEEDEKPTFKVDTAAIYAEQENMLGMASDEDAAPVIKRTAAQNKAARKEAAAAKKAAKALAAGEPAPDAGTRVDGEETVVAKVAKAPKAPKAPPIDLVSALADKGIDSTATAAVEGLVIKVQEKGLNLLNFIAGKGSLSTVTTFALKELNAQDLKVTELVARMKTVLGYSDGTAKSQSQQMSALFRALGMVTITAENRMSLNHSSPIVWQALAKL